MHRSFYVFSVFVPEGTEVNLVHETPHLALLHLWFYPLFTASLAQLVSQSLPASHLMQSTGNVQPYGPYRQPRTCQHHGWSFDAFTRKAGVDHHLVRSTIRSRRKGHQAAKFQSTLARPKIHSVKKLFSPGLGHNTYLNSRPVLQF